MQQSKTCSRCKQIQPLANFGKNKTKPLGVDSQCLPCRRISRAEYRARNPEAIAKQQADNYRRNRETRIAAANKRIYDDLERHKRYVKTYKRKNKPIIAAATRRRNARKRQNGIYKITKKELNQLLAKSCFYCGATENITIDHIIAIARGGTDSIGNLVPACKSCNSQKRDLTIMEWRKKRESRQTYASADSPSLVKSGN